MNVVFQTSDRTQSKVDELSSKSILFQAANCEAKILASMDGGSIKSTDYPYRYGKLSNCTTLLQVNCLSKCCRFVICNKRNISVNSNIEAALLKISLIMIITTIQISSFLLQCPNEIQQ